MSFNDQYSNNENSVQGIQKNEETNFNINKNEKSNFNLIKNNGKSVDSVKDIEDENKMDDRQINNLTLNVQQENTKLETFEKTNCDESVLFGLQYEPLASFPSEGDLILYKVVDCNITVVRSFNSHLLLLVQ